jgi:protein TonB
VHYLVVRYAQLTVDIYQRLQRMGVAAAIIAVHAGLLYVGMTIAPAVSRVMDVSVSTHFVDAAIDPAPRWKPPVEPVILQTKLALPVVPEVEIALEPVARESTAAPLQVAQAAPMPARVGDMPKLISTVEYVREPAPRYPPQSRRLKEQGLVVLRVLIDEKGQACDIEIESSSGHVRLDHAAKDAVARAMFRPYVEDGAPRRALVLIPIEFSLSSTKA